MTTRETPPQRTRSMRCHYEVLNVSRSATEDEIRKAYRKLVVTLHPDKAQQRGEDPDKATAAFREVQAAYECVYDQQERAYYDAHRDAILRGEDPDEYDEPPAPQKKTRRQRKQDAEDIWDAFEAELWPFFSQEAFTDYNDDEGAEVVVTDDSLKKTFARVLLMGVQAAHHLTPFLNFLWAPLERLCITYATTYRRTPPGFFPCYRDAFESVNTEERRAAQATGAAFEPLPAFGYASMAWPSVHRFYAAAAGFRSCRGFREAEPDALWDALDAAYDRKERRLVEKQLAGTRLEARRRYEGQVRKLADSCRRRDPRVAARRRQVAEAEAREAEDAERRAQEARRLFKEKREAWLAERAAEAVDEPEGVRFDPYADVVVESEEEAVVAEEEEEARCDVCAKAFGSAAALARHCQSKPHKAALKKRRKTPVAAPVVAAPDDPGASSDSSEDSPGGLVNRFAAMATGG